MPIKCVNLNYVYNKKSPLEQEALKDINVEIKDGVYLAIVGHTGSGKSTLVEHFNGLLFPTSGEVHIDNYVSTNKRRKNKKELLALRQKVGLVFQFPEYQLFEETVLKDVMFGPKNFKVALEVAEKNAKEALKNVGLDESYYERSPFELSGGEKRRVAIAGILAINPSTIVLDEPTAGLDPKGAKEILSLLKKLHEDGKNIILVTHDMDIVLNEVEEVILLKDGELIAHEDHLSIFQHDLEDLSLEVPKSYQFVEMLNKNGFHLDMSKVQDINYLASEIAKEIKK